MTKKKTINKEFSAEIGKVLRLMIHSLYTNKDIFLRELISNASDACDKLRYAALENPSILNEDELRVEIHANKEEGTLTITDNGIGMNQDDMVANLGTIASSGTQKFMEKLAEDPKADVNLIGQFGVGFYSAFMVADKVEVTSTKAGEENSFKWSSNGESGYEIEEVDSAPRGTQIKLFMKDSEVEFLDEFRIRHIVKTYSDHISFPIELKVNETDSEKLNTASALWARNKKEISEDQYKEFYHHIAHLPDNPWMHMHNKVEGNVEYTSLLYIPSQKPFDLFHPDRQTRVRLYVKRVFITDEGANLIPNYLRFVRGVVDSEDLPLNISRETLQNNLTINRIRKSIVKKVLAELKKRAEDDAKSYAEFWNNFGEVMKEGLCEGAIEEKEALLEACRFHTNKTAEGEMIGLTQYIERMVDNQEEIFYLNGDNLESLKQHPQLEGFDKRGIEVLLLPDHVDNFWVTVVNQFKNNTLKSISSANVDLDAIKPLKSNKKDATKKEEKKDTKNLTEYFKAIIGDRVKEVKVTDKLVDSPACLAIPEGAMSIKMEKYLIDQKQLKTGTAKILEINPENEIILQIQKDVEAAKTNAGTEDLVNMVFDQACILEGEELADPRAFMARMNKYIEKSLAA